MRILEINKFNHVRGGADKHFIDLVKALDTGENEVAVFSMDHPENSPSEWSKYFVSRVDYEKGGFFNKQKGLLRIFWSFEAKKKISKLLDEFRPDVVHIHNIYHQISPSILPEIKKRNIPIVMTVHDWKLICPNYLLDCEKPYCEKCVSGKYWHCFGKKCVKNSYLKSLACVLELYLHRRMGIYEKNVDRYVVPSGFVKEILKSAGFSADKISVLPHFLEDARRVNADGEKGGIPFALYVGRISGEKGVHELVEIFKDLPIALVLAGKKDEGFVAGEGGNIRYVGFRKPDEIRKLMENCRVVVSASRLPETFGLIALEATGSKKPFVGYRTGAYGEIIQNGKNGYLVENKEDFKARIKDILENPGHICDFETGKFSREKYRQEIVDIFREVC